MQDYLGNVRAALINWGVQSGISFDQFGGVLLLGFCKVLMAIFTGRKQTPVWADETVSAHTFRAARDGKPIASRCIGPIDKLFFWQKPEPYITEAAGREIASHCERAWWKEKLRRNSPPEHRQ